MRRLTFMHTTIILTLTGVCLWPLQRVSGEVQKQVTPQIDEKQTNATPVATPVYKPPVRAAPAGRVGGGTRGGDQTFMLSVLAPCHTGWTVQEQPVLYWYLTKAISTPIEFTITDDGISPLIETALQPPFQPGVQRIRLADYHVRLGVGKAYQWFVSLVVNPKRRSKDILAGGMIERVELVEEVASKLAEAPRMVLRTSMRKPDFGMMPSLLSRN